MEPNGDTFTRIYDGAGRVREEINALGNSTLYGYDAAGRLETIVDVAHGATRRLSSNWRGDVTTAENALGGTHEIEYHLDGSLAAIVDPRGQRTAYGHSVSSETRTDPLGRTTAVEYSPYGLPVRFVNEDQTSWSTTHRGSTRLDSAYEFPETITDEQGRTRTYVSVRRTASLTVPPSSHRARLRSYPRSAARASSAFRKGSRSRCMRTRGSSTATLQ